MMSEVEDKGLNNYQSEVKKTTQALAIGVHNIYYEKLLRLCFAGCEPESVQVPAQVHNYPEGGGMNCNSIKLRLRTV